MTIKPVKCKYCEARIGERRNNEFRPVVGQQFGAWQKHQESFVIGCLKCGEFFLIPINRNDVPKRGEAMCVGLRLKAA